MLYFSFELRFINFDVYVSHVVELGSLRFNWLKTLIIFTTFFIESASAGTTVDAGTKPQMTLSPDKQYIKENTRATLYINGPIRT